MDDKGTRGMSRGLVNMEGFVTQMEISLPKIKVDSKFWQGLVHHLKEVFPTLQKVTFFLPVHRYLDWFIHKGFETFKMVWMTMGRDDYIDLLWRNPVFIHLMKKIGNMTGMTWIDESRYLSMDQISVTIILIWIVPKVSIKVLFQFHISHTF